MKTVNINKLPLLDLWIDSDQTKKWSANLPYSPNFPLWSGIKTSNSSAVIFELQPGNELGEHAENCEEILFVLSGTATVVIENESKEVTSGELVVVPANTKHRVMNTGDDTARFLGFFSSAELVSTFTEEVSPIGLKELG